MKTLKIDEKEALKLYKTASNEFKQILEDTFGKDYFNQDITDKVYDIDSLCEYLEIDEDDLFLYSKNTRDKHKRYLNACNILPKIAEIYNEGVILKKNTDEYKYLPFLYFSGGSIGVVFGHWNYYLTAPFGLYYKSDNLSRKAYENFQSYFEDFWGIKA